jgi:hypothetical protein
LEIVSNALISICGYNLRWEPILETQTVELELGDRVRVRGKDGEAHIEEFYKDIEGGVRLDEKIGDFYSWNIEVLEFVARGEKKGPWHQKKEKSAEGPRSKKREKEREF